VTEFQDFRECERMMEARALEIIQRTFLRLQKDQRDIDAQSTLTFYSRLAGSIYPSTVLTAKNLQAAVNTVTGGSEGLLAEILDIYLELRSVGFANQDEFDAWVKWIAGAYFGGRSQFSILDDDFLSGLPTRDGVRELLTNNPWALVFLIFPRVSLVTAADIRGNVSITIKRGNIPVEVPDGD